jgi:predicted RNA-binding protein
MSAAEAMAAGTAFCVYRVSKDWGMCEANAYLTDGEQPKLLMEAVDLVEILPGGEWRLVNIYGDQLLLKAKVDHMDLGKHKMYFKTDD